MCGSYLLLTKIFCFFQSPHIVAIVCQYQPCQRFVNLLIFSQLDCYDNDNTTVWSTFRKLVSKLKAQLSLQQVSFGSWMFKVRQSLAVQFVLTTFTFIQALNKQEMLTSSASNSLTAYREVNGFSHCYLKNVQVILAYVS